MANRKITELTALTAPASDDVLPIIDVSEGVSANKNKKITFGSFTAGANSGTAAAPSIAFGSDPDTGLYRSAANELSITTGGTQRVVVDSTGNTTVKGDLVVQGTTTTVSSTTITVADKNLELATGQSSDTGADGGGLTIKGASDKTWNWVDATDSWTSNQHIDAVGGKVYKIGGTEVLNATTLGSGVVSSSLTSVGTLGSLNVTNAVNANSLTLTGSADVDGTMEADAYTVNGTALNEYIADTVGAMVSGNTETNIAVTYDDSDNTLDFTINSYPAASISGTTLASNVVTSSLTSVGTLGNLVVSGEIDVATLDVSGNADIDGTLEADAITVDGTALNEYIADTVGAMVSGNTETNIAVTYDDSDNTLDFTIASYPAASISGTTLASNVVTSSLTSVGTLGSLAVTNAVVAGSLDISGGADIDGTLEADAYTVDGVALNEYIADTVGAMVSSNTETDITVTYDDSDNTLDFVVGNIAGNAGTATALQTARTIGGVSFNGTANINLPGVNQTGNQNTTGSAATLTTARTIGGVSFDGSANINLPGVNAAGNQNTSGTAAGLSGTPNITVADVVAASLDISGNADIDGTLEADAYTVNGTALNEYIADTVGAMVSGNTETNIAVTYDDSDNTLDFSVVNITGNAATATALQTARTIGGVSFDGTANINLPGVNASGNQDTSGNAATATKLATARAINGVNFDGTAAITVTAAAGTLTGATLASGVTASSLTSVGTLSSLTTSGNVIVGGNLTVNGTQTIVNSTTITVDDKNLELGSVSSPSDTTANGGGITLKGATDKTFNWVSSNAAWTSSEHLDLASGKVLKIAGTQVLSNSQYTGNAATATALATARTIGGVSFNGTANINLPGVNAAGNQNTSGTSAGLTGTPNITVGDVVAASLDISGNVDIDGTLETDALTINGTTLSETIADTVGAMVTSNTETGITVTYDDADNTLDFVIGTLNQNTTGNAATATALQNARTIGGVSFDGTANINLPGVNAAGNQSTSGNAATATKLATARAINGVNFDGTAAITVAAAAGTLTGNTLASGVTASSLTSVGTLTGLTVSGNISMTGTGAIDVPTGTTAQRPGSPTTGHFRYNSTEGEFEGYTASGWGAIAGGGGGASNFQYLALRNANNNGAASYPAADFTLVTSGTANAISPAAANVLLVSVAGVIQQPNTGTSTPTTGFAISGSTIKFGSNISAAPDFIIYQLGAGIGAPSDNTVDLAHLVHKAQGDILFYGASGVPSLLNAGTSGKFLRTNGSSANPTWETIDLSSKLSLTGGTLTGDLNLGDEDDINIGAGVDLKIYSDGSTSFLKSDDLRFRSKTSSHNFINCFESNGLVQLFHSNNIKLATASGGVTVTGTCTATTFAGSGASLTSLPAGQLTGTVAAARLDTATTQSAGNNSTKIATTAYTDTAISNLVDSSPSALNTLNELAAALGDDANFSTTVTNSIATKAVLTGSTNNTICTVTGANAITGEAKLTFNGSGDLTVTGNEGVSANLYLIADEGDDNGDGWRVGSNQDTNDLTFANNTSGSYVDKITLLKTGEVGIGTSTPTDSLQVKGGEIHFGDSNSSSSSIGKLAFGGNSGELDIKAHSTGGNTVMKFTTSASGTPAERLRITSGGSVRIGGSTPVGYSANSAVDDLVLGGTSSHGITVLTGNSSTGNLWFDSENGNRGYIQYAHNEEALILGTENNERFRIDSTGRVLIGTTTEGHGNADDLTISNSGHAGMTIRSGTSSDGNIFFSDATSGGGETQGVIKYAHNGDYLRFDTGGSERLRIDSSGRLQIGASNNTGSNTKLVVGAGNNINTTAIINTGDVDTDALTLSNWDGSTATNKVMIAFDNSGRGGFNIGMPAATDSFVINDDGGIDRFWVDNSNGAYFRGANHTNIEVRSNDASTKAIVQTIQGSEVRIGATTNHPLAIYAGTTERFRINVDGEVGVGTSSPDAMLHVKKNVSTAYNAGADSAQRSGTATINIENNDGSTNSFAQIAFDTAGSNQSIARIVALRTGTSSNALTFVTENNNSKSEKLRITSNGHLLLGTGTDYADANSDDLQIYGTGHTGMSITSGTSHYGSIYFGDGTSGDDRNKGIVRYSHTDDAMQFWTAASERVRINSSGKIGFNTTSIETNSKYEFVDCVGIRNNGGGYLQRFLNSSSTAGLTGYIADDNQSALQFIAYDSSYKISFGTNNTSRLTIEAGGDVLPGADNTQDLGSTSKRWANVYCGDMNLSNKDSKNCVDSTWGEWVIQEGEEDLFLINKRKNKAYKFQLELVKDLTGSSNVKDILDGPPSKDQLPVGDPN